MKSWGYESLGMKFAVKARLILLLHVISVCIHSVKPSRHTHTPQLFSSRIPAAEEASCVTMQPYPNFSHLLTCREVGKLTTVIPGAYNYLRIKENGVFPSHVTMHSWEALLPWCDFVVCSTEKKQSYQGFPTIQFWSVFSITIANDRKI